MVRQEFYKTGEIFGEESEQIVGFADNSIRDDIKPPDGKRRC